MKGKHFTAGWSRIVEAEFKALAAAAIRQDPNLYQRLRGAIVVSAARTGIARETRDRYVGWLGQVAADARC